MKTQNTFSDGINMDVNPLVAPKTMMSNCLNGTLITFNGNENVLQNDMGNGKVHLAYLPSGWVPVGMSEHGGIIYVAAYNPESGESQIGSFPSPQLNFENTRENNSSFLLAPDKYRVFEDKELELKPGNKLAIILDNGLYEVVEPNYNLDLNKHKKHWNIQLELLTSNGALTDITEYLDNPVNNVINPQYFFVSLDSSKLTRKEVHSLLEENLRVYSGTLIGIPYLEVSENLADSMDVEILPGIENDKYPIFKLNCTIRSSSLLYGYLSNSVYEEGLIGILWKLSSKNIENSEYNSSGNIYLDGSISENNGLSSEIISIDKIDIDLRDYSVNIQAILKPNINIEYLSKDNDKLTLEICPLFKWGLEEKSQETLSYKQVFEALKIGTGLHQINQWRYYYTEDFITLTWGMESYPSMDENVLNLTISFIDMDLNEVYTQELPHDYYNGEFTELFASSIFKNKLPHIAKISWTVGQKKQADYRWIIPTALYNDFYLAKMVIDFNFTLASTPEEIEMLELKTILNNILLFANNPEEEFTHIGEEGLSPFFTLDPNINVVNITNTYTYKLNPKITSTLNLTNYPFTLLYNQPSKVTYNKDGISYEGFISNVLNTEHKVVYNHNSNVTISKLFANHTENLLRDSKCYFVIEIYRKNANDLHKDDNWLACFAYETQSLEKCLDWFELDSANTDGTIEWNLASYWTQQILSLLRKLQTRYNLFVIPIVFTNRNTMGLNYAIFKDGDWYLYWATELWKSFIWNSCPNLNDKYVSLQQLFNNNDLGNMFDVPAVVYEARSEWWGSNIEHLLGFPFYRAETINGTYLNGYLIGNKDDILIEDEDTLFNFTVESSPIKLELLINSEPYNDTVINWLDNYFNKETKLYSNTTKINECKNSIKQALTFNYNDIKVIKEFEYNNIKPGNYEVWQAINNYNIAGIPSAIRKPYLNTEANILYEYIIPKLELEGSIVYKLEGNNMIEFNKATIERFNDTNWIVTNEIAYHDSGSIKSQVGSDYCAIKLGDIYSFRGEEIFGTTKNIWSTY